MGEGERWTCTIAVRDGQLVWRIDTDTPGIVVQEVLNGLCACLSDMVAKAGLAVRTRAELQPPVVLPDGWSATADGVNVNMAMDSGGVTHTRTWAHTDGRIVEAPCDPSGGATATTVDALAATPAPLAVSDPAIE
jgi:hypothetical protein